MIRRVLSREWHTALVFAAALSWPLSAAAQTGIPPAAPPGDRLGVELFGGGGFGFSSAKDSFEAVGLGTPSVDFGGGGRVTNLWKKMFVQASVSRWSESGERAFVDSAGNVFPLGIPLDVEASYVDGTVGWKDAVRNASGRISFLSYVGAGAGVVRYAERSPFAQPGDDIETTKPSYHVLVGVEVPLVRWLAVAVDGRYRYIPNLLGDQGASSVLGEDSLGGFQAAVGLRVGFGGPRYVVPPQQIPSPQPTRTPSRLPPGVIAAKPEGSGAAVMIQAAPVYLRPDADRTPLRTLTAGTTVRLLEDKGEWVRIEFNDPQFGRRVGWVLRKFVKF